MYVERPNQVSAEGVRLGLAVSRYHAEIIDAMRKAAADTFLAAGGIDEDLLIAHAAGAFELTAIARGLAQRDDVDGVVALGCVIRGETTHDLYICQAVTHGLTEITLQTGKPIGFGLLTCQNLEQANDRAGGGKGNKGAEAMAAVLETIQTLRAIAARREQKQHVHGP
jgi:6,7-dimethyl-8-ribityllumazine synthase